MRPFELAVCAGPYVTDVHAAAGAGVPMTVRRRRSLDGTHGVAALGRFAGAARQSLEWYERVLGVACPYPGYDIVFVPELTALAESLPGLMLVNESLLNRMNDPDDDFAAMVCAHEVAHLWFGCYVGLHWWTTCGWTRRWPPTARPASAG
jgi:aminopeptidase N